MFPVLCVQTFDWSCMYVFIICVCHIQHFYPMFSSVHLCFPGSLFTQFFIFLLSLLASSSSNWVVSRHLSCPCFWIINLDSLCMMSAYAFDPWALIRKLILLTLAPISYNKRGKGETYCISDRSVMPSPQDLSSILVFHLIYWLKHVLQFAVHTAKFFNPCLIWSNVCTLIHSDL